MFRHGNYSPAFKSPSISTEVKSTVGLGQPDVRSSFKWHGVRDLGHLSARHERAQSKDANQPSSNQDVDYFSDINVVSSAPYAEISALDNAFFHRILGPDLLNSSRPMGETTTPSQRQQSMLDSSTLYTRGHDTESRLAVYSCRVCTYRSKKLCNMKAHVRTHNQEKPYSCPKCDYRATQMSNLKTHVFRHHTKDFYSIFHESTKAVY